MDGYALENKLCTPTSRDAHKEIKFISNTNSLLIIGNGFDLYFGLETSWGDFALWLEKTDRDLYKFFVDFMNIDSNNYKLWSRFEKELGYWSLDEYLEDVQESGMVDYLSRDFRDSDHQAPYGAIQSRREKYSAFSKYFSDYFEECVEPECIEREERFLKELDVITFNYNYLPWALGAREVCYIHNSLYDEKLIVGHSQTTHRDEHIIEKYEESAECWDDNFSGDVRIHEIVDCFVEDFNLMNKNPKNNIQKINFDLKKYDEVIIIGHSFGLVDHDYFKYIFSNISDQALIKISFFSTEDITEIEKFMDRNTNLTYSIQDTEVLINEIIVNNQ